MTLADRPLSIDRSLVFNEIYYYLLYLIVSTFITITNGAVNLMHIKTLKNACKN